MRRLVGIVVVLACAACMGCAPERADPAPVECTPEWIASVHERLLISEQRIAALEDGVSDLEQWRYHQDGGAVCPCPSAP